MTVKSREPAGDSRVAKFYRNFGDLDARVFSRVSVRIHEWKFIEWSTNLSRANLQWRKHPHRRSMSRRDVENETRHRIKLQWKRGRSMINYLFLRKARRRCARIASIVGEHRDRVILIVTREIRPEYIKMIRQRFLYRERSELSSLSESAYINSS